MSQLEIITVPAVKLHHLPDNARKLKDKQGIEKLRGLIRSHGFRNPLEVWKDEPDRWIIIAGNHRFKAGKLEGMKEFPCIEYTGSREMMLARALSDNASNEWTTWNIELKQLQLEELSLAGIDSSLTGIDFTLPSIELETEKKQSEPKTATAGPAGPTDSLQTQQQQNHSIFVMLSKEEYLLWKQFRGTKTDKSCIIDILNGGLSNA